MKNKVPIAQILTNLTKTFDTFKTFGNSYDEQCFVVDSGTVYHISRNREHFKHISSTNKIYIKGVTGKPLAHMGILHRNILGHNITAVYFPELPVAMLVSTQGLKSNHWETHFMISGDYIQNVKTGRILSVETSTNGLPTIDLKFDEIEISEAFVCSPCDDAFQGLLPERSRRAINLSKKQRKGKLSSENVLERKATKASKLLQRWRMCHIHQPGLDNFKCFDCLEYEGKSKSHSKIRAKQHQTPKPLMLFACDFFGKVKPTSFRGNKWVFLFICDKCGYVHGKPIRNKSQAPEVLQDFITELRGKCGVNVGSTKNDKGEIIFIGIRSDNEPVLRSEKWELVCSKNNLFESHSIPYEPEMNGKIERCVPTAVLAGKNLLCGFLFFDFFFFFVFAFLSAGVCTPFGRNPARCYSGMASSQTHRFRIVNKKKRVNLDQHTKRTFETKTPVTFLAERVFFRSLVEARFLAPF